MSLSKIAAKVIGDKRQWREYKARVRKLPANYRAAVEAFERYLMMWGGMDGNAALAVFDHLADLFEQSAADGMPIRDIVGDDPVEFVEELLRSYPEGDIRNRDRQRLIDAIDQAARSET
jgi:DNA-binding ferritin-like protein (Dps family)